MSKKFSDSSKRIIWSIFWISYIAFSCRIVNCDSFECCVFIDLTIAYQLHHCNNYRTQSIKKYSLKSFNANDRSRRILINFAFVFFKVDKFNQYLIHVFNAIDHQTFFVQSSKLILNARIRTVVSQFAHQSTITYDFQLFSSNCKAEWAQFNVAIITKIDSLSQ